MSEIIKSYKGFNTDMTCRGKQYEEGKEYEEQIKSRTQSLAKRTETLWMNY